MGTPVLGNMTKVGVGAGKAATTFEDICIFGGETLVDFGVYGTNKEYCLSQEEAFVALGDLEFGSQTYTYLWSEGSGDAANVIVKAAHDASDLVGKAISIQTEANNSSDGTKAGTTYTANFIVTGYKHLFKKGEINKTEFTVEQTSVPVEVIAEV